MKKNNTIVIEQKTTCIGKNSIIILTSSNNSKVLSLNGMSFVVPENWTLNDLHQKLNQPKMIKEELKE